MSRASRLDSSGNYQGCAGIPGGEWLEAGKITGRSRKLIFDNPEDHVGGAYVASN